jgi:hypothetical protein
MSGKWNSSETPSCPPLRRVWESQEDFDKFGETLMPILAEKGIDAGEPMVAPLHSVIFP